jgi:hypothetical protein
MLLFIVLALLILVIKSLIPLFATAVGLKLVATVAIAGLFNVVYRPGRTTRKSPDSCQRRALVGEANFETVECLQQSVAVSPIARQKSGSSLVRRLVQAKDDPAKQRIRTSLSNIDDGKLSNLGLTSEDIATLRGTLSLPAEAAVTTAPQSPSEDSMSMNNSTVGFEYIQ